MFFFFVFTCFYIGSVLSKVFFKILSKNEKKDKFGVSIFIPFSSFRDSNTKLKLSELLAVFCFISFGSSISYLYNEENFTNTEIIIHFIFFLILLISILYLAIHDILYYSIPVDWTKRIFFFVAFINIVIGLIRYLIYRLNGDEILQNLDIGGIENLVACLLGIMGTILLVKLTQNKGMGEGDIDVNGLAGLAFAFPGFIFYVLITLISGSIISIFVAIHLKKIKNVIVPFVPFILIGVSLASGFSNYLFEILFK